LSYYSQNLKAVEINSSYYGLPKAENVQIWTQETPDNFDFFVKVHKDTTHSRQTNCTEIDELIESVIPLINSNKLRGFLAQFPPSFHFNEENKEYLHVLAEKINKTPLFVEFRHFSWDNENAVNYVKELGLGWVTVDLPPIRSLPGIRPAATNSTAYVRFHGRNADTWYNPEKGDRYDWNYEPNYLQKWIIRLKSLSNRAEMTYLFFNNCHAGQAVKNALLMREILSHEFKVVS